MPAANKLMLTYEISTKNGNEGGAVAKSLTSFLAALFAVGSLLAGATAAEAAPAVDRDLVAFARSGQQKSVRVVALVAMDRAEQYPSRYNGREVVRFLKLRGQKGLEQMQLFLSRVENGSQARLVRYHWINNSVVVDVTPAGLKALAKAPNVERIYLNRKIDDIRPYSHRPVTRDMIQGLTGENWPYSLKDIGIDRLAEENPKLDGSGVVIGSVDTGVDGKHPALAGKIPLFFDAEKGQRTEPFDADSHGTHTAGTMVGGDRQKIKIAVAPGAKLIATAALAGYDAMLKGMEFMLDPDGKPETPDMPKAINNSWNCNGAPDVELFYRAISAWEAAGILPIFSAGNSGPGDETITKPHEHPSVIAVGATDEAGKITNFSSRGPAKFRGKLIEKPDLTAPGKDIVSTLPNGRMEAMSGTSMAAPHVTGMAALLWQANPKLNPQQVREILIKSSSFVDVNGNTVQSQVWSKTYGLGRSNAYAAVKMALGMGGERMRSRTDMRTASLNPAGFIKAAFVPVAAEDQVETMSYEDFDSGISLEANSKWVSAWDVWADY